MGLFKTENYTGVIFVLMNISLFDVRACLDFAADEIELLCSHFQFNSGFSYLVLE